ncbi:hypothetical protein D3C87_2007390 [compost metagenome]
MLVADGMAGRPPGIHVGMGRIGGQNPAEALYIGVITGEINRKLVHPLEVEFHAALAAVDLEGIGAAVSRSKPCCLEAA